MSITALLQRPHARAALLSVALTPDEIVLGPQQVPACSQTQHRKQRLGTAFDILVRYAYYNSFEQCGFNTPLFLSATISAQRYIHDEFQPYPYIFSPTRRDSEYKLLRLLYQRRKDDIKALEALKWGESPSDSICAAALRMSYIESLSRVYGTICIDQHSYDSHDPGRKNVFNVGKLNDFEDVECRELRELCVLAWKALPMPKHYVALNPAFGSTEDYLAPGLMLGGADPDIVLDRLLFDLRQR